MIKKSLAKNFLFDPFRPELLKTGEGTHHKSTKFIRFVKHREGKNFQNNYYSTEDLYGSWDDKWEQMICQLGYNAHKLISSFNQNVVISPGCVWQERSKRWLSTANQGVDLEILPARDDMDTLKYNVYNLEEALDSANIYSPQRDNLIQLDTILGSDIDEDNKDPIFYIMATIGGTLANPSQIRTWTSQNKVLVVKIGIPGHYTMALIFLREKRIEYFDILHAI